MLGTNWNQLLEQWKTGRPRKTSSHQSKLLDHLRKFGKKNITNRIADTTRKWRRKESGQTLFKSWNHQSILCCTKRQKHWDVWSRDLKSSRRSSYKNTTRFVAEWPGPSITLYQKIIHQQFHVKRIADAALDIYASAATLSRATAGKTILADYD